MNTICVCVCVVGGSLRGVNESKDSTMGLFLQMSILMSNKNNQNMYKAVYKAGNVYYNLSTVIINFPDSKVPGLCCISNIPFRRMWRCYTTVKYFCLSLASHYSFPLCLLAFLLSSWIYFFFPASFFSVSFSLLLYLLKLWICVYLTLYPLCLYAFDLAI